MSYFENAIYTLERMGVEDVILPFLLIFTISYVVLIKLPLFSEKKSYSVTIALVLAMAVIFPHVTGNYPYQSDVGEIINQSLPSIGLLLVAILGILLLLGALGMKFADYANTPLGGILTMVSLLIVSYIFGSSAGWFDNFYILDYINPDMQALLVIGGVFIIFVMLITGEDNNKSSFDSVIDFIGKFVKKLE